MDLRRWNSGKCQLTRRTVPQAWPAPVPFELDCSGSEPEAFRLHARRDAVSIRRTAAAPEPGTSPLAEAGSLELESDPYTVYVATCHAAAGYKCDARFICCLCIGTTAPVTKSSLVCMHTTSKRRTFGCGAEAFAQRHRVTVSSAPSDVSSQSKK